MSDSPLSESEIPTGISKLKWLGSEPSLKWKIVGQGQICVLMIAISTTFIMEIENVNVLSQIVK